LHEKVILDHPYNIIETLVISHVSLFFHL